MFVIFFRLNTKSVCTEKGEPFTVYYVRTDNIMLCLLLVGCFYEIFFSSNSLFQQHSWGLESKCYVLCRAFKVGKLRGCNFLLNEL